MSEEARAMMERLKNNASALENGKTDANVCIDLSFQPESLPFSHFFVCSFCSIFQQFFFF